MKNNILFSIIIPTYNRANLISHAINSVLGQTYANYELIVVDDGSLDKTNEVVHSFASSKIKYFKINNSERGFARNYGVENASGDYITFLDSDDLLLPNYLQYANESIQLYNNPYFLHIGYEISTPNGKITSRVNYLKSDEIYFLIKGNPLSCTGCILKSETIKKIKFNTDRNLAGSEDWELWFRILSNVGIKTDNRIGARMINHDNRSVKIDANEEQLINRKELALKYAFEDNMVKKKFSKHYILIDAYGESYIALHLALAGHNKQAKLHLRKFLKGHPRGLFTKRFLVISKYIFINLFNRK